MNCFGASLHIYACLCQCTGQTSGSTFANSAFTEDEVMYSNSVDFGSMEPSGRAGQVHVII